MPSIVTTNDTILCSHGGTVVLTPKQTVVVAQGGAVLRETDLIGAPIVGCAATADDRQQAVHIGAHHPARVDRADGAGGRDARPHAGAERHHRRRTARIDLGGGTRRAARAGLVTPARMSQPERQIGRYVIVREIGRGGMAAVYLARQLDLDRDVALKELNTFHAADPAFAERFVRESRMAGSINHPNVVTVYDFLTEGGVPYIAMEYLEAGSLRSYIGRTSLAQTIGVLEGALAGLAQAERREIIHRDIKPENLMVTSDGEVKIADFGIAKALTEAGGPNLTATGTTVGTPAYMAPEQATAGPVGPWTDLYSIGVTAYEMTVGRVPFHDSETPVAVLLRQVNEVIPPAISVDPRIDRRLSDWIERLLVKDPTARTQSARQAWYELEEIAVSMLGPLWRREARLVVSGADRAAGPLTPAPFERQTPAPEPQDEYRTFAGDAPAAPPPPPVELPPPTPPPAQTIPPAARCRRPRPPQIPARTAAPASVPAAANETFEWPAAGGRRRKIGIAVVAVALLAAAGFIAYKGLSGGSSKKATPPPEASQAQAAAGQAAAHADGRLVALRPRHADLGGRVPEPGLGGAGVAHLGQGDQPAELRPPPASRWCTRRSAWPTATACCGRARSPRPPAARSSASCPEAHRPPGRRSPSTTARPTCGPWSRTAPSGSRSRTAC